MVSNFLSLSQAIVFQNKKKLSIKKQSFKANTMQ